MGAYLRRWLNITKSLESVFKKKSKVNGEYRIRELSLLAGNNQPITIHKENGCKYKLDVSKVYFSPRLVTEHSRIADMANSNEIVLDMFAGIGPFSILIAKRIGARVYAIDKNPDAFSYLNENRKLNKVEDLVFSYLGDVKEIVPTKINKKFDRIIMNLPELSMNFMSLAINSVKSKGGLIHSYFFMSELEGFKNIEKEVGKIIEEGGRIISNLNVRKVKSTAPHEWQICMDIEIEDINSQ